MKQPRLLAGVIAASVIAPYPTLAAPQTPASALMRAQPLAKGPSMWLKGDYLPVEYYDEILERGDKYVLSEAPEGYQWVRIDNAAYLTDIASGFITDVAVDLHYHADGLS